MANTGESEKLIGIEGDKALVTLVDDEDDEEDAGTEGFEKSLGRKGSL